MNILILDDDDDFRRRLVDQAKRKGHAVVGCAGWSAALALLETDMPVELVMTGLEFSERGPNGVSFARMALRRRSGVKILFIGASEAVAQRVDPRLGLVVLKSEGVERIADLVQDLGREAAGYRGRNDGRTVLGVGEPTFL